MGKDLVRRRSDFLARLFLGTVICAARFCDACGANRLNFLLGKRLDTNQGVSRCGHPDQLVKLSLNSGPVPILRVLNDEYHQKGDDCCTGVDDELPSVGEMKQRPGQCPCRNEQQSNDEREWTS